MKKLTMILLLSLMTTTAQAAGWSAVAKRPHLLGHRPSCSFGQPVLASYYQSGRVTASGARFYPDKISVANRTLPFGTSVTFLNPRTGRSVTAVVNDRGPFGRAHAIGVRYDLSRGAARAIGMTGSQWLCASR